MAILAMANNWHDMKERLAKMIVAYDRNSTPITADDIVS